MKFALLAAAALIATPVMAQDTAPAPAADQAAPAADQAAPADQAPPPADTTAPMATAPAAPAAAPMDPAAADAAGGYQPSGPAIQGTPQPGQQVVFQPAPSPSQAFPPPPPMKNYPICKKGQYDNCMQKGGR